MQDFFCKKPDDMHYKELADRSRYFKETEGGIMKMSGIMKELIEEDRKEAAVRMIKDGEISLEKIAKYLDLPLEAVKELAENEIVLMQCC